MSDLYFHEHYSDSPRVRILFATVRNTALVAAIFCTAVSILLLLNFIQARRTGPVETEALEELVKRSRTTPEDKKIAEQVRDLDLLSRKAYFTKRRFLHLGTYLLCAGLAVMLASLKTASYLKRKLPIPTNGNIPVDYDGLPLRALSWTSVSLAAAALLVAVFASAPTALKKPPSFPGKDGKSQGAQPADDAVRLAGGNPRCQPLSEAPEKAALLENWPTFRGYGSLGVSYGVEPPRSWDLAAGEGIVWTVEIPLPGLSSPIVWKDRVFCTGGDEKTRELYCFSIADGGLLWSLSAEGIKGSPTKPPKVDKETGFAAPTPATDGRVVCAIFATGDLLCANLEGRLRWARNLGVPDDHYGHASSLLIYRDLLIVQYDTNTSGRVLALRLDDGSTAWDTERETSISWASPVLISNKNNGDQLLLLAEPLLAGYDPSTGKELWAVDCIGGEVGASPAYSPDTGYAFVANEYVVMAAVDIKAAKISWEYEENLPNASSPLAYGDWVLTADAYDTASCLEAATGKIRWKKNIGKGAYASPVLAGGAVYLVSRDGTVHIFTEPAVSGKEITLTLGEKSDCTPAFIGKRIFFRGKKKLFCMGVEK